MKYRVQMLMTSGWEDMELDGKPTSFDTHAEAQGMIDDLILHSQYAAEEGFLASAYTKDELQVKETNNLGE